jgi:competence protein ComEA
VAFADSAPRATVDQGKAPEGVVNVSSASPEELERLPGIGPAKAKAIVEHRHAHPFHKLEEVTKVKGIGRKTLQRLRPYLTLMGPTTLRDRPRARAEKTNK